LPPAAELATPNIDDLRTGLENMTSIMASIVLGNITDARGNLESSQRMLRQLSPARQISTLRQRIDDWNARIEREQRNHIRTLRERLTSRTAALYAASPQAILARGYAIVSRDGQRITSVNQASTGDQLHLQFQDGTLTTRVEDKS
jgi:exodeoxyribonuclease VII large subunit